METDFTRPRIIYSCYTKASREGENFIAEHVFTHITSGSLSIFDGVKEHTLKAGDFALYAKNNLAKFVKLPAADNGEFKALSIRLDEKTLKSFSKTFGGKSVKSINIPPVVTKLLPNALYSGYATSLISYLDENNEVNDEVWQLKVNQAVMILLEHNPELADILFDFSEPGKIDLQAFMNRNYLFNIAINRFAYLTGRSISTFKRDFEKTFGTSPSRWLQQKRLEQAYYLISKKGKKPSDVYIEVGFENLSHFSFAFKKAYGKAPSQIAI